MTTKLLHAEQIIRAAEGGQQELEQILRLLDPELRRSLTIGPQWRRSLDPDDVLQVSYIEVFLRIGTLRDRTPAGFRSWMQRLVQNNLKDAIRSLERDKRPSPRKRITVGGDGESARTLLGRVASGAMTASSKLSLSEQIDRMRRAIQGLPASYRDVIQSVELESRPVAEVAQEMGRTPGAVHLLRSRARERLSELMQDTSAD